MGYSSSLDGSSAPCVWICEITKMMMHTLEQSRYRILCVIYFIGKCSASTFEALPSRNIIYCHYVSVFVPFEFIRTHSTSTFRRSICVEMPFVKFVPLLMNSIETNRIVTLTHQHMCVCVCVRMYSCDYWNVHVRFAKDTFIVNCFTFVCVCLYGLVYALAR